jgi:hypothetical protein
MKTLATVLFTVFILLNLSLRAQNIYVDASNNTGNYIPDESWSGNDHTLYLKAGVSLKGEGRANTIIEGIIVDQEVSNLSIGLEDLNFQEFHFARGTVAGPFSDQNIIRNCATMLISLPFGAGIPVNDTTRGQTTAF